MSKPALIRSSNNYAVQGAVGNDIRDLLPMAVHIAAKMIPKDCNIDIQDLIQAGNVGLLQAVDSWNKSKGLALTTWAWRYIQRDIAREIQRHVVDANCLVSLDYRSNRLPTMADNDEYVEYENSSLSESNKHNISTEFGDDIKQFHIKDYIDVALKSLKWHNNRQYEAVMLTYIDKYTQLQASDIMGISQKCVSNLVRGGIKYLKAWH